MRVTRRTALLTMTALLVLVPTISPGGPDVQNKGPFVIDPRQETKNTPFILEFEGGDDEPEGSQPCRDDENGNDSNSASADGEPEFVLLGIPTEVQVQVVNPQGQVIRYEEVTPDGFAGDWNGGFSFDSGLTKGIYLVTARCVHLEAVGSEGSDAESSSSSGLEPAFVLLGNGPETTPQCTERDLPDPPGGTGPGCYEAQELEIVVEAAQPLVDEPTFTG